jgi:hypothetical protein
MINIPIQRWFPMRIALWLVMVMLLLAGCEDAPPVNTGGLIPQEEALRIARTHLTGTEVKWSAEMVRDYEVAIDNKVQLRTVWMVRGEYPMGNKEVYTIDASDGKVLVMMESEAPHFGEEPRPSATPAPAEPPEPLQVHLVEKNGMISFKLKETKGVNTYPMQSMVSPHEQAPVVHLIRRVTNEAGLQRYQLDAVSVYPEQKAFKVFPLADLRVKDGYSVDSVSRFYGFRPDHEQLVFIKPVPGEQAGAVKYRVISLNIRTGEQTVLMEGIPPDLSPDFLASGWMTGDGGKLVLNAFQGGKLWIADLRESTVKALDESFNHNWPLIEIWTSPDGERFWYGKNSLQLYDITGSVLAMLPEEQGLRGYPAVLWSPDGAYGVMEYTLDRSEEHILLSEDVRIIAPQGLKLLDRNGKLLWQKAADPALKLRMEWSGWLADGTKGVLHEYRLERNGNQNPRKAGSVYSLVEAATGKMTRLLKAGRLEELSQPEPVTTKDSGPGKLFFVDRAKGLYWFATGKSGTDSQEVQAGLVTGSAGGQLVWTEVDYGRGTTVLRRYDPPAGKITELRWEGTGQDLKLYGGGRWVLDSDMNYRLAK